MIGENGGIKNKRPHYAQGTTRGRLYDRGLNRENRMKLTEKQVMEALGGEWIEMEVVKDARVIKVRILRRVDQGSVLPRRKPVAVAKESKPCRNV